MADTDPQPEAEGPIGEFVGKGYESTTRADGCWIVNPKTGRITGPQVVEDDAPSA